MSWCSCKVNDVVEPGKPTNKTITVTMNPEEHPPGFISNVRAMSPDDPLEYVLGHRAGVDPDGTWKNHGGNVKSVPEEVFEPLGKEELLTIVERAVKEGKKIRASGSGHSWAPLCKVDGGFLVLTKNLSQVRPGPDGVTVIAEPGALIGDVEAVAHSLGRTWPTSTMLKTFTVGGVVSPACHGSGRETPCISDFVLGVELVTYDEATGKAVVINLDAKSDPDTFRAAQASLGCLGLVSSLTLSTVPNTMVRNWDGVMPLSIMRDEAALRKLTMEHDYVDFNWFPFTDEIWLKVIDKAPDQPLQLTAAVDHVEKGFYDWFTLGAGRVAYDQLFRLPSGTPAISKMGFELIKGTILLSGNPSTLEEAAVSGNLMPLSTALHYQLAGEGMPCRNVEWAIPIQENDFSVVVKAWTQIEDTISRYQAAGKYPCNLFGQVRVVRGSPPSGPLLTSCPAAEGQVWAYVETISFAQTAEQSAIWDEFVEDLSKQWAALHPQAVQHWAKDWPLTPEYFERLRNVFGERLVAFDQVRRRLDPRGVFVNDYIGTIFKVDPVTGSSLSRP